MTAQSQFANPTRLVIGKEMMYPRQSRFGNGCKTDDNVPGALFDNHALSNHRLVSVIMESEDSSPLMPVASVPPKNKTHITERDGSSPPLVC